MDRLCDGKIDCIDKSDEEDCPSKPKEEPSCPSDSFVCKNSSPTHLKCVKKTLLCDASNDCGDWSDEPEECKVNECFDKTLHNCTQTCVDDVIGYHCECFKGYKLGADNQTCEDLNECEEVKGTCSGHPCTNTNGHYKCECLDGYQLEEDKYCRLKTASDAFILTTTRKDIRRLSLVPSVFPYFRFRKQHLVDQYNGLESAVAIDYSIPGNYLIWSDVKEEKIYIALLDKSKSSKFVSGKEPQVLIHQNVSQVDGLTVDYIHNLVYWTNTKTDTIEVAFLRAPTKDDARIVASRMTIIDSGLDEPRAIAVNVRDGYLFWSDWGDHPKIERSNQDGSSRQVIVETDMVWPNGLAIDYVTNKIYWADGKLSTIESADFDGKNRQVVLKSKAFIQHPFAVDVFEDEIYWSDWAQLSVLKTNKFGVSNGTVEQVLGPLHSVNDIAIVHTSSQPKEARNRCSNEGCSHLCLPSGGAFGFKCLCPSNKEIEYTLSVDGRSCISHEKPKWTTTPSTHHQHISFDIEVTSETGYSQQSFFLVFGVVALIGVVFFLLSLVMYRHLRRRNIRSINFDNPVYRKTTEEQFVLEKREENESDSNLSPFLAVSYLLDTV